jgi:SAM-dependent methyltransferase
MARLGHPIHEFILDRVELAAGGTLLDLGCGAGTTLAAAARRFSGTRLIGFDIKPANLDAARGALALDAPDADLQVVDLEDVLPLADSSVDAIVCHNVLECLGEPVTLINEAARVLKPGGTAIWSHTDFDTIVINTADIELSRSVLHAYADQIQPWMRHSDPRMGRKLPGLVKCSDLELVDVDAHLVVTADLTPDALDRIDNVISALVDAGDGPSESAISAADVRRWREDVEQSIDSGDFLFAETTFTVTSTTALPVT